MSDDESIASHRTKPSQLKLIINSGGPHAIRRSIVNVASRTVREERTQNEVSLWIAGRYEKYSEICRDMLSMFLKQTKTNLMLIMQSYSIKTLAHSEPTTNQNRELLWRRWLATSPPRFFRVDSVTRGHVLLSSGLALHRFSDALSPQLLLVLLPPPSLKSSQGYVVLASFLACFFNEFLQSIRRIENGKPNCILSVWLPENSRKKQNFRAFSFLLFYCPQ